MLASVGARCVRLFARPPGGGAYPYDMSADGQRVFAALPLENQKAEPITLVENWAAALKK